MKCKKRILVLLVTILIMGVTSMSACGFLGFGNTITWKEEVLLHDGSKIVVERWQKQGGRHEIGQEPPIKEQAVTFTIPSTKQNITWKDEYNEDIGHSNFNLVALHILNATPYIITTTDGCLAYNKWGRPNPPYVIFNYEANAWKRIELAELPGDFKNINLIIVTTAYDEKETIKRGFASSETVQKLNSSLTQEAYKSIIRLPLKPGSLGVNCPDLGSSRYTSPVAPKLDKRGNNNDNK